jgi:hypothetical protein
MFEQAFQNIDNVLCEVTRDRVTTSMHPQLMPVR